VDRLEFALYRLEEACREGNLRKVDEFMEHVKIPLQSLIKVASTLKIHKSVSGGEGV